MVAFLAPLIVSASDKYEVSSDHFKSGGRKIKVVVYKPTTPGIHPAVVVLHGSGGILFDGPEMTKVAHALAGAGQEVYVVHYFNRTGHLFVTGDSLEKNFATWLGTARDAVSWIASMRNDKRKIGVFGYSLGGFIAVSLAAHDPDIGAAASHAGGIWQGQERGVKYISPMLLVHGREDVRVPFDSYVPPLIALLKKHGASLETAFYDNEDHRFKDPALTRVRQQVTSFFSRRLGTLP